MIQNIHSDKIFYLKNPKLITSFQINIFEKNTKNLFNTDKIDKSLLSINTDKSNSSISTKFDKKYKNKTTKRSKKKEALEKEDLLFNQSPSLVKSHKINKYKKKEKLINNNFLLKDQTSSDIDKNIIINKPLTIYELSSKLCISEAKIITDLFLKGICVTINSLMDVDLAIEIAKSYEFNISNVDIFSLSASAKITYNYSNKHITRAPIITILGHVDHGKTTLLDSILKTNVVNQEFGGITQAINAYNVEYLYKTSLYKLVFLDTPGHEAFSAMRLRGARITDIILLVVAADDGLKEQTIESIKYILEMKIPYIIVINKIDKQDVNVSKIEKELMNYNIISEKLGGDALFIEISALKNINIDLLLSNICLISDLQNLVSNINQLAQGTILESYLDKQQGLIANIIIQNGTLKIGDWIVAGHIYGKVKSIIDTSNNRIENASPSSIVKVLGFSSLPDAGIIFQAIDTEKEAKKQVNNFNYNDNISLNNQLKSLNTRITFNNNHALKRLNLIIKTNTQGSLEAILHSLSKISQNKVQLNIISACSSNISNTDIELALTTNSRIIIFGMSPSSHINNFIKQNHLIVKVFHVIYDLLDDIEKCMLDLIDIEYEQVFIGIALIQEIFYINKGSVAGCLVIKGKMKKMSYICVYRNQEIIYQGDLISLKHLREDVEEVLLDKECGIMCDYNEWLKEDLIYAYELHPKEKSL